MLGLAWLGTFFQLLPLPRELIEKLAPETAAILSIALGKEWESFSLSLSPPETSYELTKLAALFMAALLCANIYKKKKRIKTLFAGIGCVGAITSCLGFVHLLGGIRRPYNYWGYEGHTFVTSFINDNHQACLFGLCFFVVISLFPCEQRGPKIFYSLLLFLNGTGLFMTLSRGAIISFVIAFLFYAVLRYVHSEERASFGREFYLSLIGGAVTGGITLTFVYTQAVHELWSIGGENALDKTRFWLKLPGMLESFFLTGIGRGALESIHARYMGMLDISLHHVENEWLQMFIDWGIPLATLVLCLCVIAFYRIIRLAQQRFMLGGATALLFVAIHNLIDFNLALLSISLCVAMILSALEPKNKITWSRLTQVCLLLVIWGIGAITISYQVRDWGNSLREDEEHLRRLSTNKDLSWHDVLSQGRELIENHPGDELLPMFLAKRARHEPKGATLALFWLNKAMALSPSYYLPHLYAGRALWQLGAHEQALGEYRLAIKENPKIAEALVAEIFDRTQDLDKLNTLRINNDDVLYAIAIYLFKNKHYRLAREYLNDIHIQNNRDVLYLRAQTFYEQNDFTAAQKNLRLMEKISPHDSSGYMLLVSMAIRNGDYAKAHQIIDKGLEKGISRWHLLYRRSGLYMMQGNVQKAEEVSESLLSYALNAGQEVLSYLLLGKIEKAKQRPFFAMRLFKEAYRLDRKSLAAFLELVEYEAELGHHAKVIRMINDAHQSIQGARRVVAARDLSEDAMKADSETGN
ncbi:MAG: hypothetical protein QGI45_10715 [Myxococcota bacterium]|jgi:tetratricopeptide (TPR) repeat protein|nr:hypothetical protein [Myxococcota bacterium]